MFSLNPEQSIEQNESKDGLPVIALLEDAETETLRFLLISIYPHDHEPEITDCAFFWKVCKAVQKYDMGIIESKLSRRLDDSNLIKQEPFRVFAIARNLRWWDVILKTAYLTLGTPLQKLVYVDELQNISGADFYDFLQYRFCCDQAKDPQKEKMQRHTIIPVSNVGNSILLALWYLQTLMPFSARPTLSISS
ncbi:hypothetical protein AX15_001642 [Amanita polypyramis BW_CC]|nr:hypothetical protein AX15_001642 [Amanita polypyramis BW_CC]